MPLRSPGKMIDVRARFPPSVAGRHTPDMYADSSETRNNTRFATSFGSQNRDAGSFSIRSRSILLPKKPVVIGVRIPSG